MERSLLENGSFGWIVCGIGLLSVISCSTSQTRLRGIDSRVLIVQALGTLCIGLAMLGKLMKFRFAGEENEFLWFFIAVFGTWLALTAGRRFSSKEPKAQATMSSHPDSQNAFIVCLIVAAVMAPLIMWRPIISAPASVAFALASWLWFRMKVFPKSR